MLEDLRQVLLKDLLFRQGTDTSELPQIPWDFLCDNPTHARLINHMAEDLFHWYSAQMSLSPWQRDFTFLFVIFASLP
jgi:hypothetical protein